MVRRLGLLYVLFLAILLILSFNPRVFAARCSVSSLSYSYPQTASASEKIDVATTVAGSCASTGEDYYAVRVDLIDTTSNLTISSSDTPIGYNATVFNVTAHNPATTPPNNVTWPIEIHIYIIRAGGTNGIYLLDYQNSTIATIQVGTTPVPEFQTNPALEAFVVMIGIVLLLKKSKGWK